MYRGHTRRRRSFNARRLLLDISLVALALLVLANIAIWFIYRDRTYPRTTVMDANVGNIAYAALPAAIDTRATIPPSLQLQAHGARATVTTSELGITRSSKAAVEVTQRSWVPMLNLLATHKLAAPIRIDTAILNAKASELSDTFSAEPSDARIVMQADKAAVEPAKQGYQLDSAAFADAIRNALGRGSAHVTVPTKSIAATQQDGDLQSIVATTNRQLGTSLTIRYGSTITKPKRNDIASWYTIADNTPTLSKSSVLQYLTRQSVNYNTPIKDGGAVADTIIKAVSAAKPTDISVSVARPAKTFTYCTAVKGVDSNALPAMQNKAKHTFADPRGWSLNGSIAFKEVSSGCNFTLWLSAANAMPTFGAICDAMWSCRVGQNVVINYDRWQHASPAWNKLGGSLDEYRDMVINHEVGHWLSFGHDHCPGSGQPAPVMQQQSINLQGCTFNPWPVASELARLRQSHGL